MTKQAVAYLVDGEIQDIPKKTFDYLSIERNKNKDRNRKQRRTIQQQKQKYIRDAYCSAVVHKAKENIDIPVSVWSHNVATTVGIDELHKNGYTLTSRSGSGGNYIAVTEDTTQTINSAQTTLTAEITTNGATRAQATTRTHTAGTSTTTLAITFAITSTGFATGIVRSALFDALTTGNMYHIAAFSNGTSGVLASGDTLTVTWTITLS